MDEILNSEIELEESCLKPPCSFSEVAIRGELQRILASRTFRAAQGQKKFLAYTVEELLAGHAHRLKEYVIATDALGRKESFDPRLDPIVRTEARKLRARLAKYYEKEGSSDPLRVELRKGSYVPFFYDAAGPALELPNEAKETETPSTARASEVPLTPAVNIDPPQPRWNGAFTSFAVVVLIICTTAVVYHLSSSKSPETILAASDASIAVLPLVNLSDSNEEFLSDGLTEELIHSLRQVPGLQVVARASAFRFKARSFDITLLRWAGLRQWPPHPAPDPLAPVGPRQSDFVDHRNNFGIVAPVTVSPIFASEREIDQKLHVRAVLVGTVRNSENQLKVAVQLNNVENGYHLWSGSYERDSADIGTIAPEIASAVNHLLGAGLIRGGHQNLKQLAAALNSGAHEDYLRGLSFRNRFTVDSLNRAIEYFKRAIAEDSSFAEAYAGLADCYAMERTVADTPPLEVASKIKAAASKAIELDGTLGEPHIDLAVNAEYEFDWPTAEREFKKGLELSPDDVVGRLWYAWYLALAGRKEEVLVQRTIAARLDPVSPYAVESLGDYYSAVGRFDTAVEQFRSALALEPNFSMAHNELGDAYLFQGMCTSAIDELRLGNESMPGPRRMADLGYAYGVCAHTTEARRILQDFLKAPRGAVPAFAIAEIYIGLGDRDRAFPWLEKAIDERDLDVSLKWDARLQLLHSDRRFNALLRRMKLN